ncbi:MAG: LysR family substrate-binding domain-containing protein [Sphingomonas sp.]
MSSIAPVSHTSVELAVGLFASIAPERLGDELLALARSCPNLAIGVHEMPRAALLTALETDKLQLAILPGPERPGLQSALLWVDRVMVAMAANHPLAATPVVTPDQLRDQPFLISRQQHGSDMHRFLSHRIRPLMPPLSGVLLDLSPPKLMQRVAAGEGLALVCRSQAEGLDPALTVRPIDYAGAVFPVHAYWKPEKPACPLSELVRLLVANGTR